MARNAEAVAMIDAYLPSTATREIVSTQEVQDMLLDLRLLMDDTEVTCAECDDPNYVAGTHSAPAPIP